MTGESPKASSREIALFGTSADPPTLGHQALLTGLLRMRQGDYDAALADYAAAKKMQPDTGATWLNEGAAYIFKKDFNSALVSLEKAIELNSEDLYAAYYNRAIARENTGNVQGAYYDFVKSKELNPEFEATDRQLARFTVTTN